jgi:hypothetical protein
VNNSITCGENNGFNTHSNNAVPNTAHLRSKLRGELIQT